MTKLIANKRQSLLDEAKRCREAAQLTGIPEARATLLELADRLSQLAADAPSQ
ncbi:MAG TPA: hypothetical protein VFB45_03270 [Pseudolabrys sp.]|nr:hypothetical protein [Pseudolabrys sp.]